MFVVLNIIVIHTLEGILEIRLYRGFRQGYVITPATFGIGGIFRY